MLPCDGLEYSPLSIHGRSYLDEKLELPPRTVILVDREPSHTVFQDQQQFKSLILLDIGVRDACIKYHRYYGRSEGPKAQALSLTDVKRMEDLQMDPSIFEFYLKSHLPIPMELIVNSLKRRA
uniref:Uncharacterized protein n=1 Tax=Romanomermis culicivorax TaxID=13658 RepID=A0A915ICS1_ROMCU